MDFLRYVAATVDTSPLPNPTGIDNGTKLQTILSLVFVILGAISLLVITIAGFMYTISHGDAKIIEQAKNSILYAVVGLVVSVSAFAIINFVIGRI
jgi:uncharacterized membrane protein YidH (DUF202 family)